MATNPPSLGERLGTNPPASTNPPVSTAPPVPAMPVEPVGIQPPGAYTPVIAGRALTKCEMGLCGPLGSIGVPGQQAAYLTDGGTSVLTGPDVGGRSLLSALAGDAVMRRFGASPGALAQNLQQRGQLDLVQGQQTPQWNAIYQQALGQSGDPEFALAQANAGIGLANPTLTPAWAVNSAPADVARIGNARSRAAAGYALTGDPAALTSTEALGGFNPGVRVVGATPNGGLAVALGGGQVTEGIPVAPDLSGLALPTAVGQSGIGAVLQAQQARAQQAAAATRVQIEQQLAQQRIDNEIARNTQYARRNDIAEERARAQQAARAGSNPLTGGQAPAVNGNVFN